MIPAPLRRHAPLLFALLVLLTLRSAARADAFDYHLEPHRIADGVYVLIGRTEDFSVENGGNIVNTGFLVGSEGVVVIDSGPSRRYGEQLRAAIAGVTPLPVVLVINTHHHPDHILGNQAFPADTLAAIPATIRGIQTAGPGFLDNMYRLNGDWMRDTEIAVPRRALAAGRLEVGGRALELIVRDGHTASDLMVLDQATGTLFAADLVFNGRTPTTPDADLARWLASLDQLEQRPFKQLVPGHGPVSTAAAPIRQTRRYLQWLDRTLHDSAEQGMDMTELLGQALPAAFANLAVAAAEYRRSVFHLYPKAEQAALAHGP